MIGFTARYQRPAGELFNSGEHQMISQLPFLTACSPFNATKSIIEKSRNRSGVPFIVIYRKEKKRREKRKKNMKRSSANDVTLEGLAGRKRRGRGGRGACPLWVFARRVSCFEYVIRDSIKASHNSIYANRKEFIGHRAAPRQNSETRRTV